MIENCCCFTGHRDIPSGEFEQISELVRLNIANLISKGVNTFYCGGAIGFDILCGKTVLDFKKSFPSLKLNLALPCPEQAKYYNLKQTADYMLLKNNCDSIYYASKEYNSSCMHERNRFMVEMCNYVISYCRKSSGGTFYTVKYATKKNREIISI